MPRLMLARIVTGWSGRVRCEAGATAVEYSLLIAFIATAIIGVVGTLGGQLVPGFETVIAGL